MQAKLAHAILLAADMDQAVAVRREAFGRKLKVKPPM